MLHNCWKSGLLCGKPKCVKKSATESEQNGIDHYQGKIAFTSERDGNREIYIMNGDGSNQTNLTQDEGNDLLGYFSPDGSKIVFISDRDGYNDVFVMDIDGSDQINLTNNYNADASDPIYSPDGL